MPQRQERPVYSSTAANGHTIHLAHFMVILAFFRWDLSSTGIQCRTRHSAVALPFVPVPPTIVSVEALGTSADGIDKYGADCPI